MRTALLAVLAIGTYASAALGEPLPAAAGAKDGATAEAHEAGPVALTEAELDKIAAGSVHSFDVKIEGKNAGGHASVAGSRATSTGAFFFRISDHNSPLSPD